MKKANLEELFKSIRLSSLLEEQKENLPKWQFEIINAIWKLYSEKDMPNADSFSDDNITQIIQNITNQYKNEVVKEINSDSDDGTD